MNPLYEKIARAVRMNTLWEDRWVDKKGLVEALSNHFSKTDSLFSADDFVKECEEIN